MRRNKLSHKKAKMISSARKSNMANPFIIYDFFDQLEEVDDNPHSAVTTTAEADLEPHQHLRSYLDVTGILDPPLIVYQKKISRNCFPVRLIRIVLLIIMKYLFTVY